MLGAILLRNMDVSLSSSSGMEILALHAWSQRYLGDRNVVFAGCGFHSWGADVGSSSSSSAERAVAVVSDNSFADDFTITVARRLLVLAEGK